MGKSVSIHQYQWVWKPPVIAVFSVNFGNMFILHGFTLGHWMGEPSIFLMPPSQKVTTGGHSSREKIFEWFDPIFEEKFLEKLVRDFKRRTKIDLHNKDDLDYGWHKNAGAVRHAKSIVSRHGRKTIPHHVLSPPPGTL